MDQNAHAAHAFWLYQGIHLAVFRTIPPIHWSVLIIIWGNFPDIDALFHLLQNKNPNDMNFQHHLTYWTHWPLAYTPLLLIALISGITSWNTEIFLFLVVGILSHLLADSACCGDGVMWGKIPWKKTQFAPFVNLFSSKTDGYHGGYWVPRWRQTMMYKVALLESILAIIYLVTLNFINTLSLWSLFGIFLFIITLSISFWPIPSKYSDEPIEGRYADYRKNPMYLAWMRKLNYCIDEKYQIRKKK